MKTLFTSLLILVSSATFAQHDKASKVGSITTQHIQDNGKQTV